MKIINCNCFCWVFVCLFFYLRDNDAIINRKHVRRQSSNSPRSDCHWFSQGTCEGKIIRTRNVFCFTQQCPLFSLHLEKKKTSINLSSLYSQNFQTIKKYIFFNPFPITIATYQITMSSNGKKLILLDKMSKKSLKNAFVCDSYV